MDAQLDKTACQLGKRELVTARERQTVVEFLDIILRREGRIEITGRIEVTQTVADRVLGAESDGIIRLFAAQNIAFFEANLQGNVVENELLGETPDVGLRAADIDRRRPITERRAACMVAELGKKYCRSRRRRDGFDERRAVIFEQKAVVGRAIVVPILLPDSQTAFDAEGGTLSENCAMRYAKQGKKDFNHNE